MKIRLLYFQTLRRRIGVDSEALELPDNSKISDLLAILTQRYEILKQLEPSLLIATNQEQQPRNAPLADGDEVALMPPFSGG